MSLLERMIEIIKCLIWRFLVCLKLLFLLVRYFHIKQQISIKSSMYQRSFHPSLIRIWKVGWWSNQLNRCLRICHIRYCTESGNVISLRCLFISEMKLHFYATLNTLIRCFVISCIDDFRPSCFTLYSSSMQPLNLLRFHPMKTVYRCRCSSYFVANEKLWKLWLYCSPTCPLWFVCYFLFQLTVSHLLITQIGVSTPCRQPSVDRCCNRPTVKLPEIKGPRILENSWTKLASSSVRFSYCLNILYCVLNSSWNQCCNWSLRQRMQHTGGSINYYCFSFTSSAPYFREKSLPAYIPMFKDGWTPPEIVVDDRGAAAAKSAAVMVERMKVFPHWLMVPSQ